MEVEQFAAAIAKPGETVFLEATVPLSDVQRDRLLKLCQRVHVVTGVYVVLLEEPVRVARTEVSE